MAPSPRLSFVIVNWNGGEFLRRAIKSILEFPPSVSYDIVIVDNASTDDSLDWLRSDELRTQLDGVILKLVANAENAGFGRANNQAFALTTSRLVFLLNADAELTPGACDTLIATLRSNPAAGVCGPRLLNPDGSLQVSVWRNPPTAWATIVSGLRLYKFLPRRFCGELMLAEHWAHDRRRAVPMLGGAALLVRREMLSDVGGFDENFHMYGEDSEWCLRIIRAGWQLIFEPAAVVRHYGGGSSHLRWNDLEKIRVQLDAQFRFYRYCLTRRQAASNLIASTVLLWLQLTWRRVRRRKAEDVALTLKMHLQELLRTIRTLRNPRRMPTELKKTSPTDSRTDADCQ